MGPEQTMVLAALLAIGGGFLVARFTAGWKARGLWLVWLMAPFVILAVMIAQNPPSRSYGPPELLYAALSGMIAIPWFGGNLVGGITGFVLRRRKLRAEAVANAGSM